MITHVSAQRDEREQYAVFLHFCPERRKKSREVKKTFRHHEPLDETWTRVFITKKSQVGQVNEEVRRGSSP